MKLTESIAIMKALADGSRLMIMQALLQKSQYVEELSERLNLAASTVSFHLKKLEQANLVSKTKEQYYVIFHAKREALDMTLRDLILVDDIEKAVQDERIQQYKQKVIRSFFKDGRLRQMPAQHKKRWIVLETFAELFERGRQYQENEVNTIIAGVYADFCTIRRELVEEHILTRKDGIYRLADAAEAEHYETALRRSFQESVAHKKG